MSTVWVLWEQEWCVRFGNLNSDPVHAIPDNVVVWYLFDGSDSGNHWTTVVNILEQYSPDSFSVNSLKEIQHNFKSFFRIVGKNFQNGRYKISVLGGWKYKKIQDGCHSQATHAESLLLNGS